LIKDDDFDVEAAAVHYDAVIKDDGWKEVLKKAAVTCQERMTTHFEKYQKYTEDEPCSIKKEECDVRYMWLTTCIWLTAFIECPTKKTSDWTDSEECKTAVEFISECAEEDESIRTYLQNQKSQ